MTIFDILNSVIYSKNKLQLNCDDESQFSSFMMNRWLSFYSPEMNNYVNSLYNRQLPHLQTKQEQYDYYFNTLPTLRFKKINYIKKATKEADKKEDIILPEFLSKREYEKNVEFANSLSI